MATFMHHSQDIVSVPEKVDQDKIKYIFAGDIYRSLYILINRWNDEVEADPARQKSQLRIQDLLKEIKSRSVLFEYGDEYKLKSSNIEKEVLTAVLSSSDGYLLNCRKYYIKFLAPPRAAANAVSFAPTSARCTVLKYYTNPPVSTAAGMFRPQSIPHILDFKSDKFNVRFSHEYVEDSWSDMKVEDNRLRTYNVVQQPFPAAKVVSPELLAANGFYYIFDDDKVQCAFCKGALKDWKLGDDPGLEHKVHYATCPFVLYLDVGNIPSSKASYESLKLSVPCSDANLADSVMGRRNDGKPVPYVVGDSTHYFDIDYHSILPSDKVEMIPQLKDLVYAGSTLQSQCFRVNKMSKTDLLLETLVFDSKHHSCFPVSDEVAKNACSPKALENLANLANSHTLNSPLDAVQYYPQKHPEYRDFDKRLDSFQTWYPWLIPHWLMAKAGFFFPGGIVSRGRVECYWCGVAIKSWQGVDNPWIEHARWSPRCIHVLLNRGADFVLMVHQICPPYDPNPWLPADGSPQKTMKVANAASASGATSTGENKEPLPILTYDNIIGGQMASIPIEYRVEPRDIKGRMDLNSVRVIVSLGFSQQEAKVALDLHMKQAGDDFRNCELYIDAVWKQREKIVEIGIDVDEYQQNQVEELRLAVTRLKENTRKRDLPTGDWRLCKICMDNEVNVVFLNCGHLCSCLGCAPSMKTCPMCRAPIRGTVNTYPS